MMHAASATRHCTRLKVHGSSSDGSTTKGARNAASGSGSTILDGRSVLGLLRGGLGRDTGLAGSVTGGLRLGCATAQYVGKGLCGLG